MTIFADHEKLTAIERELGFRRRVYAVRVAEGKMRKDSADFQIEIFEAIRDDYLERIKAGRLL